jgi:galactokinase
MDQSKGTASGLQEFAQKTAEQFQARFKRKPQWIVAAPGRVNLIGEHTDYNDGFVFPMGIERYTVIAAAPANRSFATLTSGHASEAVEIPLSLRVEKGQPSWSNYCRGVLAGFQELNVTIPGFECFIDSNVPIGGGLSSSASLEVATATLLEEITGKKLEPKEKGLLAQKAEHLFAGVPCGIMDQFASVLAREDHLLLLDCRSQTTRLIPLKDPSVSVLIINSNVKHELTGGEYAERRQQCEEAARLLKTPSLREISLAQLQRDKKLLPPLIYRRAHHVVTEIARTLEAARELESSNFSRFGQLMYESHFSLRDDFEVSCRELDVLVDLAQSIGEKGGVYGSRMTGGGFGGCTVTLAKTSALKQISDYIRANYQKQTGIEPTLFISRPARGAHVISAPNP